MPPKVYDKSGQLRDLAWLKATYGAEYISVANPNAAHLALVSVQARTGPAEYSIFVHNAEGTPWGGVMVARGWPNGPKDLTVPEAACFKTIIVPRADITLSDANGKAGFATGGGDFMPNIGSGASSAWILHDQFPSDALIKIGQLGGTDHEGPSVLTFQLVNASIIVDPPPPGGGGGGGEPTGDLKTVLADLGELKVMLAAIAAHLGVPLT